MKRLTLSVLMLSLLLSGCSRSGDFDFRLGKIVAPFRFSIAGWELQTLGGEAWEWLTGQAEPEKGENEAARVREYFDVSARIKTLEAEAEAGENPASSLSGELLSLRVKQRAQAPVVGRIIEKQIRETLSAMGIHNPFIEKQINFPPVAFELQELPASLVISPREKIESMREVVLLPGLPLDEKETLESAVDGLGVSSLVVNLGGLGTFPSLVDSGSGLSFAIETAAHEWAHQYLAFTPLGFRYTLDLTGILRDYDIATMNESLAGMVGKEIGALVMRKYYSPAEEAASPAPPVGFDFNAAMREIRRNVDDYLAGGEITQAEAYMERERQALAAKGYFIRKLNQAYFAFHGTYADSPAFLNPIGVELKELRAKSASLKDFLKLASGITSRQDLAELAR